MSFSFCLLRSVLLCLDVSQRILAGQVDSALLVDLNDLYHDLVPDGNHIFHFFYPILIQLGNMNQAILAGCDFHECAKGHEPNYLALIDCAKLRIV